MVNIVFSTRVKTHKLNAFVKLKLFKYCYHTLIREQYCYHTLISVVISSIHTCVRVQYLYLNVLSN